MSQLSGISHNSRFVMQGHICTARWLSYRTRCVESTGAMHQTRHNATFVNSATSCAVILPQTVMHAVKLVRTAQPNWLDPCIKCFLGVDVSGRFNPDKHGHPSWLCPIGVRDGSPGDGPPYMGCRTSSLGCLARAWITAANA